MASHDTILSITLPSVGTQGTIIAQRGDLAEVMEFSMDAHPNFEHDGRLTLMQAVEVAQRRLNVLQQSPPPVFSEPEVETKQPEPKAKKPAKTQKETKPNKAKLDAAPTTAPRVEEITPSPASEKLAESNPDLQQLSLF